MRNAKMNKINFFIALTLLFSGFVSASQADEKKVVTIGVSLPLTGPVAKVGVAVKNSIILADEKYDLDKRVEFIFEDDSYTASKTVSAVNKFISQDKVAGLIIFGSSPSLAVNSIAEKRKIPMVAISTATQVTDGMDFVVRHWLDPDIETAQVLREVEKRQYQTLAIVTTLNDGTLALRDEFLRLNKKKVVYDEQLDPSETTFHSIATKIKSTEPSAVYILLMPPQSGILARQLRNVGYTGDFFSGHPLEIDEEIKRKGNALLGTWYATTDDRAAKDFSQSYRNRFKEDPIAGCSNGHDIAKLFIQGLRTQDANKYLHTVQDFTGALGSYGANGKNGFTMGAVLKVVNEQGIRFLDDDA